MISPRPWSRKTSLLILVLFIVANFFLFLNVSAARNLEVSYLDVGNGDAVLVRSPSGAYLLIDAGGDASILRELGATLSYWRRDVDVAIQTHADTNATAGFLDVFDRYRVRNFIQPPSRGDTQTVDAIREAAEKEPSMHLATGHRGGRIDLGGGAYADILYPAESAKDASSLIVKVAYGKTAFLFSGRTGEAGQTWIAGLDQNTGLSANVLLVEHEGAKDAFSDEWLSAVSPETAVISVAKDNRYEYPATSTKERLENAGVPFLTTSEEGRITFVSDGVRVWRK